MRGGVLTETTALFRDRLLPQSPSTPVSQPLEPLPARAAFLVALAPLVDRFSGPLAAIYERLARWQRQLGWALAAAILVWLGWRLEAIGWTAVWQALPRSPFFYALVVGAYLVLPVADALIYRRLWGTRLRSSLGLFFRKRVYNSALVGYSGEVSLALWARGRVERSDAAILHAIKDVNLLSAVVSGCGGALLVVWLATRVPVDRLPSGAIVWWGMATVAMALALPAVLLARRGTLAMTGGEIIAVLEIHAVRFALGLAALLAQWWIVLPGATGSALLVLLALYVLVGRIPFVPNRDVLFVGIALALSDKLALASAPLAGVLLATSALQQAFHLVVFALSALVRQAQR